MTSRRPNRRTVSRTSRSTSGSEATSHGSPSTRPEGAISFAAFSTESFRRDASMTEAPSRRNAFAAARPIPRDPPVTMATFPPRPRSMPVLPAALYHHRARPVNATAPVTNCQERAVERLLYDIFWSHYCEKARFCLDFKRLPYTLVRVNPFTRRQVIDLGARGDVPVLNDGDRVIAGSDA